MAQQRALSQCSRAIVVCVFDCAVRCVVPAVLCPAVCTPVECHHSRTRPQGLAPQVSRLRLGYQASFRCGTSEKKGLSTGRSTCAAHAVWGCVAQSVVAE